MTKKYILVLLSFFYLTVVPVLGIEVGKQAPEISLKNLSGTIVNLSDFRNKSDVLLVFWATWCPSCRAEIPELIRLHQEFSSQNLTILAINTAGQDLQIKVEKFVKAQHIPYTVLYDQAQSIITLYRIIGIPTNILINQSGIIVYRDYVLPSSAVIQKIIRNQTRNKIN